MLAGGATQQHPPTTDAHPYLIPTITIHTQNSKHGNNRCYANLVALMLREWG